MPTPVTTTQSTTAFVRKTATTLEYTEQGGNRVWITIFGIIGINPNISIRQLNLYLNTSAVLFKLVFCESNKQ